jgi:hypothetical protein
MQVTPAARGAFLLIDDALAVVPDVTAPGVSPEP